MRVSPTSWSATSPSSTNAASGRSPIRWTESSPPLQPASTSRRSGRFGSGWHRPIRPTRSISWRWWRTTSVSTASPCSRSSLTSSPRTQHAHKVSHRHGRRCRCSSPTTPSGSMRSSAPPRTPNRSSAVNSATGASSSPVCRTCLSSPPTGSARWWRHTGAPTTASSSRARCPTRSPPPHTDTAPPSSWWSMPRCRCCWRG